MAAVADAGNANSVNPRLVEEIGTNGKSLPNSI
jgi:hypothetical protein